MLRHLAYVSRPVDDLAPGEIARIIRVSRVSNPDAGINGMLVFAGDAFAQWIEGPSAAVGALWERIRRDPRHADIVVLVDQDDREVGHFSDWRAGFPADAEMGFELAALRRQGRLLTAEEVARFRGLLQRCDVA